MVYHSPAPVVKRIAVRFGVKSGTAKARVVGEGGLYSRSASPRHWRRTSPTPRIAHLASRHAVAPFAAAIEVQAACARPAALGKPQLRYARAAHWRRRNGIGAAHRPTTTGQRCSGDIALVHQ